MTWELAVVILAAGASRRFGSPKQLAEYRGKTLLERSIDTSLKVSSKHCYVVLGAHYKEILPATARWPVRVIENRTWNEGIASSIRVAVDQLQGHYRAILFLAVDQVAVTSVNLAALISVWRAHPTNMVTASYGNTLGIPAIFPASFFPELLKLQGDRGAKQVIREHADKVLEVAVPEAARDIDHRSDISL